MTLTDEQRSELRTWAASRTLPAGDVFRARLILALADGQTYNQIKTTLQTTAPTISRWKQRFEEAGMAGLDPRHKGSQPRIADAQVQARIARKTQQKPADGSTHWSCRKMAKALGLSKSTVQRVWAQARLKPHRLDSYMASNDPRFEEKAADIIGLYMNPPQHAAVFCVDEKTAIQALDRLDPVLPLSPGRAERHGFEYYRHGTLSLYAALDVKTGEVHGMTASRHTAQQFIAFLRAWWNAPNGPRRFTWSSTIFPRTRPKMSRSSSWSIRKCGFTSLRPIRHGSIRSSCGSRKSSAT
jgi:transposase